MKKRIDFIDILKGIGIILVVLAHTGINEDIKKYIYSFHMPLFFILSGYLYKDRKLISQIIYRGKKMVGWYLFFVMLSSIIPLIYVYNGKNIGKFDYDIIHILYLKGRTIYNAPLWFLISLYFTETIYIVLDKYFYKSIFIRIIFFIFLNKVIEVTEFNLPFGISISLASLILYQLGRDLKNYDKLLKKIKYKEMFALFIVGLFIGLYNGRVDLYKLKFGTNIIYYYISLLTTTIFFIKFSKIIYDSKYIKLEKILKNIGENTLIILGTHYIIFWFYDQIIKYVLGNAHTVLEYYGGKAAFVIIVEIILIKLIKKINLIKKVLYEYRNM